jgi:hypothetical protein
MFKSLVVLSLELLSKFFVNLIPDSDKIKAIAVHQVANLSKIAKIYTDDNPENGEQMRRWFEENRKQLVGDGINMIIYFDDAIIQNPLLEAQIDSFLEMVKEHLINASLEKTTIV